MSPPTVPLVALAGSPNAGKSVLFNALTGLNQKVGNYPGVTVERKLGVTKPWNGKSFSIVDLPGTYSLDAVSLDEKVAFDVIFGHGTFDTPRPDVVITVVDAANLDRTLGLVLELKTTGLPLVVSLNMMDLAQKRGLKLNVKALQRELGVPVIPMIATRGDGVAALMTEIDRLSSRESSKLDTWTRPTESSIASRYHEIDRILAVAVETPTQADIFSWKIDRVVLHPVWGTLILVGLLMTMFQAVFTWAGPAADGLEASLKFLSATLKSNLPSHMLTNLLTDGIIAGVGSVLVFLPQIMLLFLFINLLEASGYMTRSKGDHSSLC
ncbi:MAG: ferrous iron transporter B [Proteobacteria bacterium]|nr:ferrous iron transporter B [Pseudomonadota bacterium]